MKEMHEKELEFFKDTLASRKVQIEKNIRGVEKEMNELRELELNDNMVENAIGHQQELELFEIDIALAKIKEGTFGICEMCEECVGVLRLKVKPHAKYCIDCREIAEKSAV